MGRSRLSPTPIFIVLCLSGIVVALACQVPVFRYALERWAPAEYLVSVTPSGGGLTDSEKKLVEALRAAPGDAVNPANIEVQVEAPGSSSPAQLALHYPNKLRDAAGKPIWQVPLNDENVRRLVDSPARQELRQRLLAGESAIWVLVESGDRAKDDAAFAALAQSLEEAAGSLKLPDGVVTQAAVKSGTRVNEQADVLRTDLPLKISFSTLRVRRDDPAEVVLLAMLTHMEPDLGGLAGEPMAFPVFGRGRTLEPLVGAGIHKGNVIEHSTYLCGACSCEVKDQNPGIDLLVAANWSPVDTTPQLEIIRIAPTAETPPARRTPTIPIAIVVALIALAFVAMRRRSRIRHSDFRPR
ncbi:MAG: hypothetical protein ABMA13_05855 [Chthoniobacteraceae bacterium]